jgi:X-Pro dipeptidyl-peptidase
VTSATWRISKGILDSSNRDSLYTSALATPGEKYEFKFPVLPTEYTIPAGHQLGVILLANFSMGRAGTTKSVITVDTKASKVILPVTGGASAVAATGAFAADTTAPALAPIADIALNTTDLTGTNVSFTTSATDTQDAAPTVTCDKTTGITTANSDAGGTVPATLSLVLGTPATFGQFVPGVTRTYESSTTATVTSSAGDALLSVADPSATATGHLVNGAFSLAQPLQARARNAANSGTPYNNIGSSASPLNLLAYNGPTSNDAVTVGFSQLVNQNDPLRTGSYSKTLTFTLSTTTP